MSCATTREEWKRQVLRNSSPVIRTGVILADSRLNALVVMGSAIRSTWVVC